VVKKFFLFAVIFFVQLCWAGDIPQVLYLSFDQRLVISYGVQSMGLTEAELQNLLARATQFYKKRSALPVEIIQVSDFDQFLSGWRGEWPNTHRLDLDLSILENSETPRGFKIFKATTPELQKKIDDYISIERDTILKLFKSQFASEQLDLKNVNSVSSAQDRALAVFEKQFDQVQNISTNLMQSESTDTQDPSERAFGLAVRSFFSQYFKNLGLDSKKRIVSAMLGENINLSDAEKFEVAVQNSGPLLQKLLQVMARQTNLPPTLKTVAVKVENAVKPVPWVLVKGILSPEKSGFRFDSISEKPLGVGSMAQNHKAVLRGQTVVARFIKPDIEQEIDQDTQILSEVAKGLDANPEYIKTGAPKMSPLIDDIAEGVRNELDIDATIKNQVRALSVYTADIWVKTSTGQQLIQFRVPKIISPDKSALTPTRVMVQEFAEGSKLDEALGDSPHDVELKRILVEALAELWTDRLLFGGDHEGYFYHADPHQGNYLVKISSALKTILLDYGMAGNLTVEQRNYLILFGIAVRERKLDLITESLWNLSITDKNSMTFENFKQKSQEFSIANPKAGMVDWTAFAVNAGLKLHPDFVNMNRGMIIFNKTLAEYASDKTVTDFMKKSLRHHPGESIMLMSKVGNMKWYEILKVGVQDASEVIGKSCQSFFQKISIPGVKF
jgi:predicted unusual protein kinase regulating ubiquinone biosynthesis (AarF/ABC1/UbiB family)